MAKFKRFNSYVGSGVPPAGWVRLRQRPLLILVGLTGVGKTTTVAALQTAGLNLYTLPNRRTITDWQLIPEMQAANGEPEEAVGDRTRRFAYTRQYRQKHPGGMAHALSNMAVCASTLTNNTVLLFDGLRGANEVTFAAQKMSQALFLFLDAPDFVRVQRLLQRNDLFDQVGERGAAGATAVALDPTLTEGILTDAQTRQLNQNIHNGQLSLSAVIAKLTIVQSERKNYKAHDTLLALQQFALNRLIYADTTTQSPATIAQRFMQFLNKP